MSVRLLKKFRDSPDELSTLSHGARFVLHLYCDYADNFILTTFVGTPTLMRLTGYSERQLQRYVQECRERGFLAVVKNRGGRRQYAVHRVNLGVPVIESNKIPEEVREKLARMGLLFEGDGTGVAADDTSDQAGEEELVGE